MKPYLEDLDCRIYHGDALSVLRELPSESVHMVATSPPFYALRDYGTAEWQGGEASCDHVMPVSYKSSTLGASTGGRSEETHARNIKAQATPYRDRCGKCGAVRVDHQLGLEASPEEYVANLVEVFREVRRVLRNDGTFWVEIGDSYASGNRKSHGTRVGYKQQTNRGMSGLADPPRPRDPEGIKPKDLIGIPWLLAFALRADGWFLRSEIIWHKPDGMPSSVRDRPTLNHSTIFLLSKNSSYFFDPDSIREPYKTLMTDPATGRLRDPRPPQEETLDGSEGEAPRGPDGRRKTTISTGDKGHENYLGREGAERWPSQLGANARSVWTLSTESTSFAHFASWPSRLISRMIKAGTSEYGCCPECGAPWERQLGEAQLAGEKKIHGSRPAADERGVSTTGLARSNGRTWRERPMLGWQPTCQCERDDVAPCVILDPFVGAGTTCLVARHLGRHSIGIELSEQYLKEITVPRLSQLSLLT